MRVRQLNLLALWTDLIEVAHVAMDLALRALFLTILEALVAVVDYLGLHGFGPLW